MSNDKKKPATSKNFSPLQPAKTTPEVSTMSAAEIEQALEAALMAQDYTRALELLDAAPRWMKKQPEFKFIRANILMSEGSDLEAFQLLRELERKSPRFTPLYLPLAMYYVEREWPAHALQAAKRALSDRDLLDEDRAALNLIIEGSTGIISNSAAEFGLSFETMQRAGIFHEQAQIAMDEDRLSETEHNAREAIKLAPDWNPPHNNRAQALYYLGRTSEAIAVSEGVLAREPENFFARSRLVIYHSGVNQLEQARIYANHLAELSENFPADSPEMEHVITSLALVEDTHALWKIARRYLDAPSDALFDRSWHCLAVAAIRSNQWQAALTLLKKNTGEELSLPSKVLLDEMEGSEAQRKQRLSWMPPTYPGADMFFHPKILDEWDALLQGFSDPVTPSQIRKAKGFLQKYPFMVAAMKRLLWAEVSHHGILAIFEQVDIPEMDAEILRFGLSQTGSQETRIQAILLLIRNGRYTGPKVVKLWNEEEQEWREVELNQQRIGDVQMDIQPKTLALIEKAYQADNPQEAIALLRKAIELEPTCPTPIFNLGVVLASVGEDEEGEALIRRSIEVDPNYTYGHAMLALSEAHLEHEREALDHLEVVTRADIIAPDTAVIASLAWLVLDLNKHEPKSARQRWEMAAQIAPDHRLVLHYKKVLEEAEEYEKKFGFLIDFQRKSAQRAHQKLLKTPRTAEMGLRACLETNTKEMLVGSAHFLNIPASGKKGEVVSTLTGFLLNEDSLERTLAEALTERELAALRWMLETGGVRPWQEFSRKFGNDQDESTDWDYHEPVSIPGRLRRSGLFFTGLLDDQQVAFIPADARALLHKLLA